ncbi:MAG: radical SAM protein, partial [bacterium]|nr:radical SAM protein [bacterium]
MIALVRRREMELPEFERPTTSRRAEVREIRVDRLLIAEGANQYYINPYVGCMIGCEFCYVAERADFSRGLRGLPRLPWGRYVDVKINAAEILRAEVRRRPPGIVRLSPILTDPYQPLERRYRITRQCLEVLLEAGFTPVILTRAARVVDDIDVLARFSKLAVGLSVPTDDDRVRISFEPGGDPINDRLAALERLHGAGIPTFAVVQPILPMQPERLVERLAPNVQFV